MIVVNQVLGGPPPMEPTYSVTTMFISPLCFRSPMVRIFPGALSIPFYSELSPCISHYDQATGGSEEREWFFCAMPSWILVTAKPTLSGSW